MIILPHRRSAFTGTGFQFTVKTDNAGTSGSTQFLVPTDSLATYDCHVDWGDGNSDDITTYNDAAWTHTYSAAGTYTITITGQFGRIKFNNGGDRLKILNIIALGAVGWESFQQAFFGCQNMAIAAGAEVGFNRGTATICSSGFRNCDAIVEFPAFDFTGIVDCDNMLRDSGALTDFLVTKMGDVTDVGNMFLNTNLDTLDAGLDWSSVANAAGTFRNTNIVSLPSGLGLDLGNVTTFSLFATNTTIATADYDEFLEDLESVNGNSSVTLDMGNATYTIGGAGETARTALINDHSWTINDGGGV